MIRRLCPHAAELGYAERSTTLRNQIDGAVVGMVPPLVSR
jgi:hypothetical protein